MNRATLPELFSRRPEGVRELRESAEPPLPIIVYAFHPLSLLNYKLSNPCSYAIFHLDEITPWR